MDSVSCQDIQREHNTNIPIIYYTDVPWKECAIVPGNEETVELIRMEQQNSVALRQYSYKISKGVTMDVLEEKKYETIRGRRGNINLNITTQSSGLANS